MVADVSFPSISKSCIDYAVTPNEKQNEDIAREYVDPPSQKFNKVLVWNLSGIMIYAEGRP